MIVFAIVIAVTVGTIDHLRLVEQVNKYNQFQIEQTEDLVKHSLQTIEKAYYLFGKEISSQMEASSNYLIRLYQRNPTFDEWNFTALKNMLGFDIYIINEQNVITHSSYPEDIGLDFNVCCPKLSQTITERRNSGEFFADGIDIEQTSGNIKKYSYMATPDKKYTIQLGYNLQNGEIFQEFNFLHVIQHFVQKYPSINDINILNTGGFPLGEPVADLSLPKERREAFEHTRTTKETTEVTSTWGNEPAVYRYVHYTSEYDDSATKNKIIEIIYNQDELQSILTENRKSFLIQLLIVLVIMIVISFILSNWLAEPLYLAFHDSLTGLKNRASFEQSFAKTLADNKETVALLMIDIDDFKTINDNFGHDIGDYLLKFVARSIRSAASKKDIAFRLGGDEFVMIMPSTDKAEAERVAQQIIASIENSTDPKIYMQGEKITVSIGISMAPEHGAEPEMLYKKADLALYASKKKGKNQYQFYSP